MRQKRRIAVIGVLALVALAVCGALLSFTYQHFEIASMQTKTVVSNYDIPNAQLNVSQVGGLNRYEVSIPYHGPVSDGTFLVQLVFGDPVSGEITRVAYGTYGSEARIGGSHPLNGTGGVVLDAEAGWVADASASIGSGSVILDIDPNALSGGTLMHAEVFGTDAPLGLQPGDIPLWQNLPSKVLMVNLPQGTTQLPSIPGAEEGGGGAGGGEMGAYSFLIPPQTPPRNITPPRWGPPPRTWQPNPPVPPAISTNFDGDGSTDYQLPGGDLVPGGGDIHFGCIVIDNAYMTFVIWRDRNGDGIIQRNECFGIIGQCVFSRGENSSVVYKDANNHRHIVIINRNIGTTTQYGVPPGGAIVYNYDVETGNLVVSKVNPDGSSTVVYSGPPSGYDWYGL